MANKVIVVEDHDSTSVDSVVVGVATSIEKAIELRKDWLGREANYALNVTDVRDPGIVLTEQYFDRENTFLCRMFK